MVSLHKIYKNNNKKRKNKPNKIKLSLYTLFFFFLIYRGPECCYEIFHLLKVGVTCVFLAVALQGVINKFLNL